MSAGRNKNSKTRLRKAQRKAVRSRKAVQRMKHSERLKQQRDHQRRLDRMLMESKAKSVVNEQGTARIVEGGIGCLDCGEPYDSPRFPDLVIENEAWKKIAPNHDEGGLLCPNCICARLELAGICKVASKFTSGPLAE